MPALHSTSGYAPAYPLVWFPGCEALRCGPSGALLDRKVVLELQSIPDFLSWSTTL